MIDNSDYCIFYYKENYKVNKSKKVGLITVPAKSGTKQALKYATMKNKEILIINKE